MTKVRTDAEWQKAADEILKFRGPSGSPILVERFLNNVAIPEGVG